MQSMYLLEMMARQKTDELMREAERERIMRARLQAFEHRAEGTAHRGTRQRGPQPVRRAGLGWR